jgi:hypothetical protein
MQEGVLRRIASSNFSEGFILKGGLLLFSLSHFKSRPTKDIDLLGRNIPNDVFFLTKAFKEILSIKFEDGLLLHTKGLKLEPITEGAEYQGQRLKVRCNLGNIRTILKLDIGFGDKVYPNPMTFQTRNTRLPNAPAIFTEEFKRDKRNIQLWETFLDRINADHISFGKVIELIRNNLSPIYQSLKSKETTDSRH